ncbi:CocE/NonD family hydrolase [Paenibacillus paeoniae]|uniref:CocE/NonD family hydrolase n=1 Tax=Paenibacillus paeoniae TaxID=2292705 RepID=UPI001F0CD026|nr:CocE/NonD family hydrolase [Paenibacillus paeoniae]
MTIQPKRSDIVVERNRAAVMRDGVKLYADIYRPDGDEVYPVLLLRTPYNKEDAQTMNYAHPSWYASHGYVVIVQDTRGRWRSEGEFWPYEHDGLDGYDTVEWAAALPFSNGKVGMYGFSYAAAIQWLAALEQPPSLQCIAPAMIGSDSYQGKVYRNGAFALASSLSWALFVSQDSALRRGRLDWASAIAGKYAGIHPLYKHLPLASAPGLIEELVPYYREWLEHPSRDDYWRSKSLQEQYGRITVPALHYGGWYDIFADGTIQNFNGVREGGAAKHTRDNQQLHIGPWYHMPWSRYVGELDFGEEAVSRIDEIQLEWFGRWLKPEQRELPSTPAVSYFLMGENRWRHSVSWPPPGAKVVRYYLHSERKANSINGDGELSLLPPEEEPADVYVYHPSIPVPALGGRSGAVPDLTPMGPRNQLPIEVRNDVLVYTSEPLDEDIVVVGEISVVLYAETTAEDTDFVAKLVDVYPGGGAYNVAEGIVRARYRHSLEKPEPLVPGEIVAYTLSLGPTAIAFKRGHAIRLDVTSSLFPTYDRNPNRIIPPGEVTEADFTTATQTIYHDRLRASYVALPVLREKKDTT